MASALIYKELGIHHPLLYTKNVLQQFKNQQLFFLANQRTEVAKQIGTSKSGKAGISEELQLRSAYLKWEPLDP